MTAMDFRRVACIKVAVDGGPNIRQCNVLYKKVAGIHIIIRTLTFRKIIML